jgi:hypothetical protein
MKKIRLDVAALHVQSFPTGKTHGGAGTVKALSGEQIMNPSDWNPLECAPSGVDTGSMCGCGQNGTSGLQNSCDQMTCFNVC